LVIYKGINAELETVQQTRHLQICVCFSFALSAELDSFEEVFPEFEKLTRLSGKEV
jgi:hypothetical protein